MNELQEAWDWWNNLTSTGKSQFPHTNPNDEEVQEWYSDPAGYSLPPNITY